MTIEERDEARITRRLFQHAAQHLQRAADQLEAAWSPQLAAECDTLRCRVQTILDAEITE